MAIFNKTVITEKGYSLIAKSILNNSKINFTKIVASDYDYSKLSEEDIEQLEALEDIKQSVLVNDVKVINESTVNVSGILSNTELKEEYYLRAIGLFAADPQENKEILYSITVAKEADCFPSFDGNNVSNVLLDLETIISKSSKIDLEVNPNATATIKNLNDLENKINEKVEDITTHLNENTQNINLLKTNKADLATTPQQMTKNISYYISPNGKDDNNGISPTTPFKTINKAISLIPEILNYNININLNEGQYNETILIKGKNGSGTLAINGGTDLESSKKYIVNNITLMGVTNTVVLTGLYIKNINSDELYTYDLYANNCMYLYAKYLFLNESSISNTIVGVQCHNTTMAIAYSSISNKKMGILANNFGRVMSIQNQGAGNIVALQASLGSSISKTGSQLSGTTQEVVTGGGVIG